MEPVDLYRRFQDLQAYVGWDNDDARRIQTAAPLLHPYLDALIDDFYAEIERHPDARKVITGGQPQIERLKGALIRWIRELLSGPYDQDYVARRWRVGWRHVEVGLEQIYTNVALSRLRTGLMGSLGQAWPGERDELVATLQSLNKLLDLDLAKIEYAYQTEHLDRHQRNERLAAIGKVAGGVAHELRNPLNVISTSVYFLLNARNASPEKVAEHLRRIDQHVSVANGVVTALSNFAKMPLPTMSPFSVAQCVREALETNSLGKSIELELDFPATLPSALGDINQIRIVFGNLIRNARDAMPNGGRLTVSTHAVDGSVEVSILDTGVGIAKEQLVRIMEPLYSTKPRGLGLGLALAKAIVEKHHGTIRVESEAGKGSAFTVKLTTRIEQAMKQ